MSNSPVRPSNNSAHLPNLFPAISLTSLQNPSKLSITGRAEKPAKYNTPCRRRPDLRRWMQRRADGHPAEDAEHPAKGAENTRWKEPGTWCKEPDTRRKEPDTRRNEPDTQRKEADTRCKEPHTRCKEAVPRCKEPDTRCKEPNTQYKEPDTWRQEPDTRCKELNTLHKEPGANQRRSQGGACGRRPPPHERFWIFPSQDF